MTHLDRRIRVLRLENGRLVVYGGPRLLSEVKEGISLRMPALEGRLMEEISSSHVYVPPGGVAPASGEVSQIFLFAPSLAEAHGRVLRNINDGTLGIQVDLHAREPTEENWVHVSESALGEHPFVDVVTLLEQIATTLPTLGSAVQLKSPPSAALVRPLTMIDPYASVAGTLEALHLSAYPDKPTGLTVLLGLEKDDFPRADEPGERNEDTYCRVETCDLTSPEEMSRIARACAQWLHNRLSGSL